MVPWWNEEVKKFINHRKKLLRIYRKNNSVDNLKNYQKAKAKSQFEVKKARRESWNNYIESIDASTTSKEMWTKIRSVGGWNKFSSIKSIIDKNGSIISNPKEMANCLAESFEDISSNEDYSLQFRKIKEEKEQNFFTNKTNTNTIGLNSDFTMYEMSEILNQVKSESAGPDGLPYQLYKNLSIKNKQVLLNFYNNIWRSGSIPIPMKSAHIIPIIKDPKKPPYPSGFRPISLLNCNAKILEKMVNRRLIWYLESKNKISKFQAGFRRNHSTNTNTSILESEIAITLFKRHRLTAVFFDIEKAYDRIWRRVILEEAKHKGINGNTLNFIMSFLNDRTFNVRLEDQISETRELINGVPQGSALSVTLFLLAMEKVVRPYIEINIFSRIC